MVEKVERSHFVSSECPVCHRAADEPFVRIGAQPVHCNVLHDTRASALATLRGDLDLSLCPQCGHIFNRSFDPALTAYGGTYENSLHHSPVFQEYAAELVQDLVERHDVRDRDIVEIGAGQGEFLQMLCAAGDNRGTGFDPSHVGATESVPGVRVVAAFYGEEFIDHPADLIVCRHVLEHIELAGDFVAMVRRVIGDRPTKVFFEVPDARWTLENGGVWDLIYEHCGYFTPASFAEVFRRSAFRVDRIGSAFGGQFSTLEATPVAAPRPAPPELADHVAELAVAADRFAAGYREQVGRWKSELARLARSGERPVIWGAGSKGVSFLNAVDAERVVEHAVDINPRKRGKFIAGTGQAIVAPESLTTCNPDVVLVMNPNYRSEIELELDRLGVAARVVVV